MSNNALLISVVSHGHSDSVRVLLHDLAQLCAGSVTRVVLTLNQPGEPIPFHEGDFWPFALQLRRNTRPLGFGANHNQALAGAEEAFLCILNPDVRLMPECGDVLAALVATASQPGTGCSYPVQLNEQGALQDSERELPTPAAMWHRYMFRRREARVDWVNAACLMFPQPVWQHLGGFDEFYSMYCEDVDLCLRMRLAGLALVRAPVQVIHSGQRASHRRWSHLKWHVRSLLRLWRSPVYRQARQMLLEERQGAGNIGSS